MASKFPANSSDEKQSAVKSTSRKTIRRTTAALALKADDGDDDDRSRRRKRSSASKDTGEDSTAQGSDGGPSQVDRAEVAADRAETEADRAQAEADRAAAEANRVGAETAPAPEADQAGDAEATSALADTGEAAKPAEPEARAESQDSSAPPPSSSAAALEAAPAEPVRTEQPVYATLLPPHAIGTWPPDSPAPPPGRVPSGDSRSLRRFHQGVQEFVLIYRYDSFLIKRAGIVGQQGTWTVVEYPHIGAAAHAYAQECSTLTGAGYYDLR